MDIEKELFRSFEEIKNGSYNGRPLSVLKYHRQLFNNTCGCLLRSDEMLFLMYHDGLIKTDEDIKCLSQNLQKSNRTNKLTKYKTLDAMDRCAYCNDPATLKCSKCQKVRYCSKQHQKKDWVCHKKICCAETRRQIDTSQT